MTPGERIAAALHRQAEWCGNLGSVLYAAILERCAQDAVADGPVFRALEPFADDSWDSALALRFMAGVHRLALRGAAPEIAAYYPSCGGSGDGNAAASAVIAFVDAHAAEIRSETPHGVQTNEVARCAALLGGFYEVHRESGLPLRIFEIGASAGLNLLWDQYFYAAGAWSWGPHDARLRFEDNFIHPPTDVRGAIPIVERAGCDIAPIDATTGPGRAALVSFMWADQTDRIARIRAACDVARAHPVSVERAGAHDWLSAERLTPQRGTATVVFHSVMMQYVAEDERTAIAARVEELGAAASSDAPFAHLFLEPPNFDVILRLWPGGATRTLAHATPHGREIDWL